MAYIHNSSLVVAEDRDRQSPEIAGQPSCIGQLQARRETLPQKPGERDQKRLTSGHNTHVYTCAYTPACMYVHMHVYIREHTHITFIIHANKCENCSQISISSPMNCLRSYLGIFILSYIQRFWK